MKNLFYLTIFFLLISFNFSFAQVGMPYGSYGDGEVIRKLKPNNFKSYDKKLLVVPAFKAIGTKKFLSKRLDKFYKKPYHVADVKEVASGLGPENYSIEEYKYMIFIQSHKSFSGNTEYSFYLVDRSTNTVYSHPSSGNMVSKYLKKLMK